LQVVVALLVRQRRGDRINLEAARIERPAEAADDAALAGGIPPFEDDDRAFARAEIGLLDRLHLALHGLQLSLVVLRVDLGMLGDGHQLGPLGDEEVLGFHDRPT
jgi:hypothetical protein